VWRLAPPPRRRCIETVFGDKRKINVAIAVAKTAVGEATDEVSANESFAELRPIHRRERIGKRERGSSGHLVFAIVFSRHELPMTGAG
jgi:hypothetical protein